MHITAHTTQVISPFGSGYLQEDHGDDTRRHLAWVEPDTSAMNVDAALSTMTAAMCDQLLQSLRDALSLGERRR